MYMKHLKSRQQQEQKTQCTANRKQSFQMRKGPPVQEAPDMANTLPPSPSPSEVVMFPPITADIPPDILHVCSKVSHRKASAGAGVARTGHGPVLPSKAPLHGEAVFA